MGSPWSSNWYEEKLKGCYSKCLYQDLDFHNYFFNLYKKCGFYVQKFTIERNSSHLHIQIALIKTNFSKKAIKITRKLNRNKMAIAYFSLFKKRKFQQRQILFFLKEKHKVLEKKKKIPKLFKFKKE